MACRSTAPLNARDHGAGAGGPAGDAPAINRALRAAQAAGNPCVYLPPGDYFIRQLPGQGPLDVPIRPEIDGLTLFGAPGGTSRIVLEADAFALLVNKADSSPPAEVRRLTLRDLTIEVPGDRGWSNAGVIQLNHCTGVHVTGVSIHMNGRAQFDRGLKMSGLVTSQGTTGLIERVLVDGPSKAGIYLATGTHDLTVKDSELRSSWSAPPINAAPPGLSISGAARITVTNLYTHHNRGDGLFIATPGPPPAPPAPWRPAPTSDIRVLGGRFWSNAEGGGAGIRVASAYPEVPRDILLSGVDVRGNAGPGILIEAGRGVEVRRPLVAHNGAQGIFLRDVLLPGQDPALARTAGVRLVDPEITDNGRRVHVDVGALEIRGRVESVELTGGRLGSSDPTSRQRIGVALIAESDRSCAGFTARGTPEITAPLPFALTTGLRVTPLLLLPGQPLRCPDLD